MTTTKADGPDFASSSLPRHLIRGLIGFGSLIGSFALIPIVGPVSLLLLPVGVLALRGCPMCWTIGLIQTVSRGRLRRSCEDGQCRLTVADRDHVGRAGPDQSGSTATARENSRRDVEKPWLAPSPQ